MPWLRMTTDRVWSGYPWVSGSAGSGLGMVFHPRFSGSGPRNQSGSVLGLVFHPVDIQWISEINHLELKLMFYNILIIIYLLRLLNLFKVDS